MKLQLVLVSGQLLMLIGLGVSIFSFRYHNNDPFLWLLIGLLFVLSITLHTFYLLLRNRKKIHV